MSDELEKCYQEIQKQNIVSLKRNIVEDEDFISKIISDFVVDFLYDENGKYDEKRIKNLHRIVDLYHDNFFDFQFDKYKRHKIVYPFSRSFRYATEFLKELGYEYINSLKKCCDDGTFWVYTKDDIVKYDFPNSSICLYDNGKNHIYILCDFNASDTYSIIHETIHTTNFYKKEMGKNEPEDKTDINFYTWDFFTETESYFSTRLARMYFEKKYPENKELQKEYYLEEYGFNRIYYQADFMIKMLDIFLEKGRVSAYDISEILTNVSCDYYYAVVDQIAELKKEKYFIIINKISYLLSNIVVNHILVNHDYEEAKQIFYDMNNMIKNDDIAHVFKYLGLDVETIDKWFVEADLKEYKKLGDYNVKRPK